MLRKLRYLALGLLFAGQACAQTPNPTFTTVNVTGRLTHTAEVATPVAATMTNGSTVSYPATHSIMTLTVSGTIATGTIILPTTASIASGFIARIVSTGTVTALTVTPASGQSIASAPTRISPTVPINLYWDGAASTWRVLSAGSGLYNPAAVAITGGSISGATITGGSISGTPVSGSTGSFTNLSSTNLTVSGTASGPGFGALFASPADIGTVAPGQAYFTNLNVSGTLSGAAFAGIANFASPPVLGSTTPNTVNATNLTASGTVSGAGFTARLASPGPIGSTSASTGAFTTLSASGAVSGAGFTSLLTTLLGAPPAIGSVTPASVAATTLAASSSVTGAGFTARFSAPGPIGDVTPSTGAFTTLSASGTVSGAGMTARFASPGPIGSTAASTGAFTTLSASSTVSGSGFLNYLASPPTIGGVTPAAATFTDLTVTGTLTAPGFDPAGAFASPPVLGSTTPNTVNATNLTSSGTVSGTGFTARFASPGPIGSTTASTGAFTTLSASGAVSGAGFTSLLTTLLSAPPAIGGVTPAAVSATSLTASSTVAGSGFIDRFAAPGPIGNVTPSTGAFTTLSASGTVSGAGMTARFASPGPIGSTAASTGAFTTLSASGAVSGAGFINYFASPPTLGSVAPAGATFTDVTVLGTLTAPGFDPVGPIFESPPVLGSVTPNTVNATGLSASGTVSGAGFVARFASPGPIGNTAPSTGAFTTFSASGASTLGGASANLLTIAGAAAASSPTITMSGSDTDIGLALVLKGNGIFTARRSSLFASTLNVDGSGNMRRIFSALTSRITGVVTNGVAANYAITVSDDDADSTGSLDQNLYYQYIGANLGGTGFKGGRVGLGIGFQMNQGGGTSNAPGSNYFHQGISIQAAAAIADAGTMQAANGQFFGAFISSELRPTARYWEEIKILEGNISIDANGSSQRKYGITLAMSSTDATPARTEEAFIVLGSKKATAPNSLGMRAGIIVGGAAGYWGITSGGTIMGAFSTTVVGPPPPAMVAGYGVEFSSVTFGGAAWRSTGATIDGGGNIGSSVVISGNSLQTKGAVNAKTAIVSGLTILEGGAYVTVPPIVFTNTVGSGASAHVTAMGFDHARERTNGGSGYVVNEVLTLALPVDGACSLLPQFTVTAVSAGAVIDVKTTRVGVCETLPTSTTLEFTSSGSGTGAQLKAAWTIVSVAMDTNGSGYVEFQPPLVAATGATRAARINASTSATSTHMTLNAGSTVGIPTATPASAGASCTAGTITFDTGYIYACTATNTWKRAAIATW